MPEIPKGAKRPADRLKAEAETVDSDQPTVHEFKGHEYRVLSFFDWDKTAMTAINRLDMDGWAAGALHPDDVARFITTRATLRETIAFVKSVTQATGVDVGELFASQSL